MYGRMKCFVKYIGKFRKESVQCKCTNKKQLFNFVMYFDVNKINLQTRYKTILGDLGQLRNVQQFQKGKLGTVRE